LLNPGFTTELDREYGARFVLPDSLAQGLVDTNAEFDTGDELRTQRVFGDELWSRLRRLGLEHVDWEGASVLDACCGTGFLSYHLLARRRPRKLTLLDLSPHEVEAAERLVSTHDAAVEVTTLCADLADAALEPEQFDIVIGNSFLHHFPDVPKALGAIYGALRPGGLFIGLHEPAPAATPLESGQPYQVGAFYLMRARYWRNVRYKGPGPVVKGTTDIWIFERDDVQRLLADAGFDGIRVVPRYLLRPLAAAVLRMHLTEERSRLSRVQSALLGASVRADLVLQRLLPDRLFGGLAFAAVRPA
jgi:SAM-dependent methyltransferase